MTATPKKGGGPAKVAKVCGLSDTTGETICIPENPVSVGRLEGRIQEEISRSD